MATQASNYIFQKYLDCYGFKEAPTDTQFNELGKTYRANGDALQGYYWYYTGRGFSVNIHDFYFKKEWTGRFDTQVISDVVLSVSYFFKAHGKALGEHCPMSDNMILARVSSDPFSCTMFEGLSFYSIGFEFHRKFLESLCVDYHMDPQVILESIDRYKRGLLDKELFHLAQEIKTYSNTNSGAELFYEIKAKEFLLQVINAYYSKQANPLSRDDDYALHMLQAYIDKNYNVELNQDDLSEMTYMSKSKLKRVFKQKFGISMTEYIQRKRIDASEELIESGEYNIKDVAEQVGYKSASRFTSLYKQYKGVLPSEMKERLQDSSYN